MPQLKLLDQVRRIARARHLSRHTEDAYVHYIKHFILFHGNWQPSEIDAEKIEAFLNHLMQSDLIAEE